MRLQIKRLAENAGALAKLGRLLLVPDGISLISLGAHRFEFLPRPLSSLPESLFIHAATLTHSMRIA